MRAARWLIGMVALLAFAGEGACAPPAFDDYVHTAWTARDGAPEGAWALAQTRDGWLWLGGAMGVYRFDGLRFEEVDFQGEGSHASRAVSRLWATRAGDLWVAHASAGASLRRGSDGRVWSPPGLPERLAVDGFLEHPDGRLWVMVGEELFAFDGARWRPTRFDTLGLPATGGVHAVMRGSALWVSTDAGLMRMDTGEARFTPVPTDAVPGALPLPRPDGRLWEVSSGRGLAPIAGADVSVAASANRGAASNHNWGVMDHAGAYWSAACPSDAGVCRVSASALDAWNTRDQDANVFAFEQRDGLSSNATMTLLVDRDGDVWVGTKAGLDRFHRRSVTGVAFPTPLLYFAMVPEPDGALWLGTAARQSGPDRLWRVDRVAATIGTFDIEVSAAYRDADGTIVGGGRHGLWRFDGADAHALAVPDALQGQPLQAVTRDGHGRLWIGYRQAALFELRSDEWIAQGGIAGLTDAPVAAARTDAGGAAWFGYYANRVVRLDGDRLQQWREADGVATGTVTAIAPGDAAAPTFIGGERGLALLRDGRFHMLHTLGADRLQGITGLLRGADGALWINGMAGVLRIDAADLQRASDDPATALPHRLFDADDGVAGSAQQGRPFPTLVEGTDGRMWIASANGLGWLQPRALPPTAAPPPAQVRDIDVDGTRLPTTADAVLPPNPRRVSFAFTALNLAHPARTLFRYRLDGFDAAWQDAGARRDAVYTNLGPGDYRFSVMAANEDGVWGPASMPLSFSIAPNFVQSWWFVALCALGVLALVAAVHALRLRALRLRIEARHDERHRIARDLHDTLLQGVQGMLLRMQTWAVDTTLPAPRRVEIDRAAEQAREMLVEGRDRILALRDGQADADERDDDLAQRLQSLQHAAHDMTRPTLRIHTFGTPRRLQPDAADAIHAIAREAVLNAFAHAGANDVTVDITHARRELSVCVRDDGCGIDAHVAAAGERSGHWGLVGMRERARRLGATLAVSGAPGTGTQVALVVPARIAYARDMRRDTPPPR